MSKLSKEELELAIACGKDSKEHAENVLRSSEADCIRLKGIIETLNKGILDNVAELEKLIVQQ